MTLLQELAAYLTAKLNAIIARLNMFSSILPFPETSNNGGKGFVLKVKDDQTGYEWQKTDRLAPFIESAFPMLINYNNGMINLYVYGGNLDPNTVFDLGNQVSLGNVDYNQFGLAVLKATPQEAAFDAAILAYNGSTSSWGDFSVFIRNLNEFVPDNTGSVLWVNVTANAWTGLGFIEADNPQGWDKSGDFQLDVSEQDFQLRFQMKCTGGTTSAAAAGITYNANSAHWSDLEFAFKRDYYHVQISEGNNTIGAPIAVSDNTQYAIVRKGDEIFYFIDNRLVRKVSGVDMNNMWFDCSINRTFRIENISFEK